MIDEDIKKSEELANLSMTSLLDKLHKAAKSGQFHYRYPGTLQNSIIEFLEKENFTVLPTYDNYDLDDNVTLITWGNSFKLEEEHQHNEI